MQGISRWKLRLSYVMDIRLLKLSSEINGDMELFLSRGQYKLSTANAIYSFGKHYRSFGKAFEKLGILNDLGIERVLVLGWGIGSIADLLRDHSSLESFTGIEHDHTLIELYQSLTDSSGGLATHLVHTDAIEFVKSGAGQSNRPFDLICSDIFIDNLTPSSVISEDYINGLIRLGAEGARILVSKLNMSVQDRQQNNEFEDLLSSLEIDYEVINTFGNRMYTWTT
ncbi:MAG: hypothetical protein GY751_18620 [Bacteroidetes bacterium]|nr:hypothetical protein [Bacteroidota bacterium]